MHVVMKERLVASVPKRKITRMLVNKEIFPMYAECGECGSKSLTHHLLVDEDDWNGGGYNGILNKISCIKCGTEEKVNELVSGERVPASEFFSDAPV